MAGNLHSSGAMALYVVMRAGMAATDLTMVPESAVAGAPPAAESCETLFWALDGRDVVVLGRRWRIEVFSVVEWAGRRYMQLSLTGPAQYMLTLRITPGTRARQLIPAVLSWLAQPTGSGEVLDVL